MKRNYAHTKEGRIGWSPDRAGYADYFHDFCKADAALPRELPDTEYRIAFSRPSGEVSIFVPDRRMMALLMQGGVFRRMRTIGETAEGNAVFIGSAEVMGALSEREAIEFLRWKQVPLECNHWKVITQAQIPADRIFRDAWRLAA